MYRLLSAVLSLLVLFTEEFHRLSFLLKHIGSCQLYIVSQTTLNGLIPSDLINKSHKQIPFQKNKRPTVTVSGNGKWSVCEWWIEDRLQVPEIWSLLDITNCGNYRRCFDACIDNLPRSKTYWACLLLQVKKYWLHKGFVGSWSRTSEFRDNFVDQGFRFLNSKSIDCF